jgi:hypothetical protein
MDAQAERIIARCLRTEGRLPPADANKLAASLWRQLKVVLPLPESRTSNFLKDGEFVY